MASTIVVYTDGSCIFNGKRNAIGGYGVYFPNGDYENVSEPLTKKPESPDTDPIETLTVTNNRAELMAILTALNIVKKDNLLIYTDSKYCKLVVEKYCFSTSNIDATSLKNPDMLKRIQEVYRTHYANRRVELKYVAAHRGTSKENDIADDLAVLGTAHAIIEKNLAGKLKATDNLTYVDAFARGIKPHDKLTKFVFEFLRNL